MSNVDGLTSLGIRLETENKNENYSDFWDALYFPVVLLMGHTFEF